MIPPETLEVWLRGPLPGMPPLVQPVAHALLQAREELGAALHDFPPALLNARPAGVASVGFHLQHLSGVLDRLLTYARDEALSPQQLAQLAAENPPLAIQPTTVAELVRRFGTQVDTALNQLLATTDASLTEPRGVGRTQIPSTTLGLLVHAAEHTQRHMGQLLVTARWVRAGAE